MYPAHQKINKDVIMVYQKFVMEVIGYRLSHCAIVALRTPLFALVDIIIIALMVPTKFFPHNAAKMASLRVM